MNSSAASFPVWHITRGALALERPLVMGIINVTPDSFSDGGSLPTPAAALAHCERLLCDGADILDIGAESTRPGSCGISAEEELARLLPVLRSALRLGAPVSVDTSKPAVMRAALEAGADIINDVAALAAPGALEIIARHGRCGVCLMHGHAANAGQGAQQAPMPGGTDGAVQGVLEFFRLAKRRHRAWRCWHGSASCLPSGVRCSSAPRANHFWRTPCRRQAARRLRLRQQRELPPASPLRCWRRSVAPPCCACTTCARRCRRWPCCAPCMKYPPIEQFIAHVYCGQTNSYCCLRQGCRMASRCPIYTPALSSRQSTP